MSLGEVGGRGRGQRRGEASPASHAEELCREFISELYCSNPARPATSCFGTADYGKHANSVIEVDLRLLEPIERSEM